MADVPATRYAVTRDGARLAYKVMGDGPVDVIVGRATWGPVDLLWDEPRLVHFLTRLSSFCRHIWFDPRGTGASDSIAFTEDRLLESSVDDMLTVIDAVGCGRVVPMSIGTSAVGALFAATHPKRTSAVVLVNCFARYRRAEDYPEGLPDEEWERILAALAATGHPTVEGSAPSLAGDAQFRHWFERATRLFVAPQEGLWRMRAALDQDLRGVLGSVRAPTLVVYRRDSPNAARYRYLADHVPGAECVEVPGDEWLPFVGDSGPLLDAIETFLTGELTAPEHDRVLATVLFTDLVSSTPQLAEMGDRRWRNLIATHDALVRAELDRFHGQEVRFDGDGVLATFDGPGRAVRCACAIRDALGALGLDVRAGLHTGEIELRGDGIEGIAVVVGKRVSSTAGPGQVLVSRTVADLIAGSGIELRDEGEHELKGVPGTWRLFSVST